MSALTRDWTDTVWPAWLLATLASFGVLEVVAYRSGRHTLSRALQRWLGVHPRRDRWHRVAAAGFLGGWAALLLHVERLDRR